MTPIALAYIPVALVARLPDGQLVVLHGQAAEIETSVDVERRAEGYRTTVEWRAGEFAQTRMSEDCPGVELRDEEEARGPLWRLAPILAPSDETTCYRCSHASLRQHNAGGCVECSCSSPFGGTT